MKKKWNVYKKVWKFILLCLLLLLSFSYAMFQGGFVSWFLFYSFLPFAIYCFCLSVYSLNDFEITRILPKLDFSAGESLNVTVTVKRRSRFPLFFAAMTDEFGDSLMLYHQKKTKIVIPGFKKEFSYEYKIDQLPRGEHLFHSFKVEVGDVLGLFEKEKSYQDEAKVIVYPSYTPFFYRPMENHYEQGYTASRERVQRDTSMAIGVRDYHPGDRFSWINWKASAKRSMLMTKEFEQRQSHDVLVVMDCMADRRFEIIVSFTASLVRAILKKGAQTGLLTFSKEKTSFPIRGGEAHLQQLFYHLAKIDAKAGLPLDKVLEAEGLLGQQLVSVILVTASLTKPLIQKASFLRQRKGTVTIFLIKEEKESPDEQERSLFGMASTRGLRVVMVHEGQFGSAFSEVNAR